MMTRSSLLLPASLWCVLALSSGPISQNVVMADDAASASSDEAAPNYEQYVAQRPFRVGYCRLEFDLELVDGSSDGRQLDVWYPTEARERRYNYFGQIGFAAVNAEVADGQHPLLVF